MSENIKSSSVGSIQIHKIPISLTGAAMEKPMMKPLAKKLISAY
jgi:hypothetical protein